MDEKEARDELGLGSVRDAFSDLLFPGTNAIQTRLGCVLFVPWLNCLAARARGHLDVSATYRPYAARLNGNAWRHGMRSSMSDFGWPSRMARNVKAMQSTGFTPDILQNSASEDSRCDLAPWIRQTVECLLLIAHQYLSYRLLTHGTKANAYFLNSGAPLTSAKLCVGP